ncbi:MAG: hypothetical protein K2Q06_16530 [Parvularculaceae bacterium]|nr:hypothetical protein [Parvularculaceae bacterium]
MTPTQFKPLDQPTNPLTDDEGVQINAGAPSARYVLTAGDGDSSAPVRVDLGPRPSFEDDGPKLAIDPAAPDGGDLKVGNTVGATDSASFLFDPGSDGSGGFLITDAPDTGGYAFRYVNAAGQAVAGPTGSIIGALNGVDLYSLSIASNGQYTFTLLSELPGTSLSLDTRNIKAGAPDTNSIEVSVIGASGDLVRITGGGGAINESNANVGVKNGNLDAGESLSFQYFSDTDPNSPGRELQDISSLTMGTKTANTAVYNYVASDNGSVVFTGTATVGKNGALTVTSPGSALFDTVTVTSVNGNAVKIGLSGIFIEILPDNQTLDFTAVLKDGDSDQTTGVNFQAFIDGDGDGIFTGLGGCVIPGRRSAPDLRRSGLLPTRRTLQTPACIPRSPESASRPSATSTSTCSERRRRRRASGPASRIPRSRSSRPPECA